MRDDDLIPQPGTLEKGGGGDNGGKGETKSEALRVFPSQCN